MTDEEREAWDHAIELYQGSLLWKTRGLTACARRLENAVKNGAYEKIDVPALAECLNVLVSALDRAMFYIDVDKATAEEKRQANS